MGLLSRMFSAGLTLLFFVSFPIEVESRLLVRWLSLRFETIRDASILSDFR